MRFALACSALLIIYIDPAEPDRFVGLTYSILTFYVFYSALLLYLPHIFHKSLDWLNRWSHWIDVSWYLVLIALSSGVNSIFFMFFFFAILVASFRRGFRTGLTVAIVASLLFSIIGYLAYEPPFSLNRFLLRPVYLFILGYVIAYRGGFEITLRRRLALLKEVGTLSSSRFGVGHTVGSNLERLRAFYDADECLIVHDARAQGRFYLRRVRPANPEEGFEVREIAGSVAVPLLGNTPELAGLHDARRRRWFGRGQNIRTFCISGREVRPDSRHLEIPAGFFEDQAVITVPIQHPAQLGRLWLTSRRHAFHVSDIEFIHQIIESITSVVDNIRLVDKLATSAADEERRRLARDLHDGVIQPYIGIQIGLTAARNQLERACPESKEIPAGVRERLAVLGKGLDELLEMTESGIRELREIVYNLRGGGALNGHLVEAVQRFASRFADATGIGTCVEVDGDIRVSDRVAGELFRMVEEGLSNIRRHTESPVARIKLSRSNGSLILKIENDIKNSAGFRTFIPNSIAERAAALQGTSRVECEKGSCAVIVTIPIPVQQMVAV